jgi:hypothetical protein
VNPPFTVFAGWRDPDAGAARTNVVGALLPLVLPRFGDRTRAMHDGGSLASLRRMLCRGDLQTRFGNSTDSGIGRAPRRGRLVGKFMTQPQTWLDPRIPGA